MTRFVRDPSMRAVALLLGNLATGGAELQAVELARQLPSHGWWPVFLVAEDQGALRDTVRELGFPVHALGAEHWRPRRDPRFWTNLFAVMARIRQVCAAERCVVLQSHLFWQDVTGVPAAFACRTVMRIVTSRRSTGDFKDGRPLYNALCAFANTMTDAVVCNSRGVLDDTLARERLDPARAAIIFNGIDVARFANADPVPLGELFPASRQSRLVVGMVANLKPVKRHDLFLRALAIARRDEPSITAVFVGDDHGDRAGLEALARELGCESNVFFAGGARDPAPWYRAFDAVALTSDYEGMPNTVLEAMAASKPVVATRVSGATELLEDGRAGRLAPLNDAPAIATHLVELARDAALRGRLGAAGHALALERFDMSALGRGYAQLYELLLAGGKPGGAIARPAVFPRAAAPAADPG